MSRKLERALETLLDLDGEVFPMDNGYWTKINAKKVVPTGNTPHGIRYSLTLHDSTNTRVLGYDNAHAFNPRNKSYGTKKIKWDHKHKKNRVTPYEFKNAGRLLEDFWADVNLIVENSLR